MKIVIAGAGNVGTALAQDLVARHHDVTLLEQRPDIAERAQQSLSGVDVHVIDACEVNSLRRVGLREADVVIAATGDDEDNLVLSWLAKQEFGVPRTIARVNHPKNQWLFDEMWGVDTAVSTPALIMSQIEEAVEVGSVVKLMDLAQARLSLFEVTLDDDSPVLQGTTVDAVDLPRGARIVALVRDEQNVPISPQSTFHAGDHVVLMASTECVEAINAIFCGA
jgi:trk system potassium uptake protein TrkA